MQFLIPNILKNYSDEHRRVIKSFFDELENQRASNYSNSIKIKDFTTEYLKYIENNFSQSYLNSVRLSLTHLSKYFGEQKPICEISILESENFKISLMKNAPRGYSVYIRTLRAALSKAIDWNMLSTNPFAKIKITQHQQVIPKFLTKADLMLVLKNTDSPVIRNLFIFGFFTGCRLGEIVNLKWSNVNLEQKAIRIGDENFTSKNKKSRLIPMCTEVAAIFETKYNCRVNENYVFAKGNGFRFHRDYISRYFKKCVTRAGLSEELHFHSLRHSFASNLAAAGVPIILLKTLLGHSSVISTQIYCNSNFDSLKVAVGKFDE